MIDRIEELLAMPTEEDEEEQEDVTALPVTENGVPVPPRGDGEETGDSGTEDRRSGERAAGELASERPGPAAGEAEGGGTGGGSGGRTAGEIMPERPGLIAGEAETESTEARDGGRTAGEIAPERPGSVAGEIEASGVAAGETAAEKAEPAGELWKVGPVWTVQRVQPGTVGARRTGATERTVRAGEGIFPLRGENLTLAGLERTARGGAVGLALERAGRSEPAQTGLEQISLKGLYRQTVRGLRPAAPALSPELAGRTARAQEPGSAASLTVDELDRAVRRDSRRYDGGMSIY